MMLQKKLYLATSLILLAGCRPEVPQTEGVITIPFEQVNAINMGQFIDNVRYLQLENHPESAFTDIDKMITAGENIFMLDKRLEAVFCFDTTGKFRYRIQHVGRGPGEYKELDAMWVNPAKKELWLQSFWPAKIMVYDFDGQMLHQSAFSWPAMDMINLGEGLLVGYNNTPSRVGNDSLNPGLFLLGQDGKCLGQALSTGDNSIYWSLTYQRHLEKYDDGALLLCQSDTIFKINKKGKVSPDACLDWGKLTYPEENRRIRFDTPGAREALKGNYVKGKDHLLAFGPIRLFRAFVENHLEFAVADLNTRKGMLSTQITSPAAKIPLLYPIAISDQDELIGMYDMTLLLAMKESKEHRSGDSNTGNFYHEMDSLVESALNNDRPVLWIAKIKKEWLTKTY